MTNQENEVRRQTESPGFTPDSAGAWTFFKAIAGPDATPYPAASSNPTVYNGRKLANVKFTETVGVQSLTFTETTSEDRFFNLSTADYIELNSVVACFRKNSRWWTIDKVQTCDDNATAASVRKYDSAGTLLWSRDHGTDILDVTIDQSSGVVYAVGSASPDDGMTTRAYKRGGCDLWSANHGATVRACALDGTGNLYTLGDASFTTPVDKPTPAWIYGVMIRKYSSTGVLLWSAGLSINNNDPTDLAVFGSYLYPIVQTTTARGNESTIPQFDLNGDLTGVDFQRSQNLVGNYTAGIDRSLAVDSSGDIHVAGERTGAVSTLWPLAKFDDTGLELWQSDDLTAIYGVRVTTTAIWTSTLAHRIAKFDLGGGFVSSLAATVGNAKAIDARVESDSIEYIYASDGQKLHKHKTDYSEEWNVDHGAGTIASVAAGSDGVRDCVVVGGSRATD